METMEQADVKTVLIASVCHEANRAYCVSTGDFSQLPWTDAPDWQRKSAILGVTGILDGRITRPEQSHESWLAEKQRDGWKYGPVKNVDAKEHPCFVPYADLPAGQQKKDALFFAVVTALKD